MAGDGEKSLSQTTTSASQLSEADSGNLDLVNVLNMLDPSRWEDVQSFLEDNVKTSTPGSLPPVATLGALPAQIKTEPKDDYPCCGHSDMTYSANTEAPHLQLPFGTYPNQMSTTTTRTAGAIEQRSVKTEPAVQPACSGSTRKARKPKVKDEERKERRKAQNRQAAKVYREKQKTKKEKVENDYGRLISENAEKENEISSLRIELERLQQILDTHKHSGCCQIRASVQSVPKAGGLSTENSMVSRIPKPIDIPNFALGSEADKAPQVPPYTPSSEQSFGFEANIYSPQSDEKTAGRGQVYSPLDGQDIDVDLPPVAVEVFNHDLENLGQQNTLLDLNQWNALDYLR